MCPLVNSLLAIELNFATLAPLAISDLYDVQDVDNDDSELSSVEDDGPDAEAGV